MYCAARRLRNGHSPRQKNVESRKRIASEQELAWGLISALLRVQLQ